MSDEDLLRPLLDRNAGGLEVDFDEDEFVEQWRTPHEVAERCVILCCVAASPQFPNGYFNEWLRREGLWGKVSPLEQALLTAEKPAQRQTINATWRSESLQVLLWCIRKLADLPPASQLVSIPKMLEVMPDPGDGLDGFYDGVKLRSSEEFEKLYEETYHQHWQVRDAQINGRAIPVGFDPGIVVERHYAMNWVRYYEDQGWDDVSTDT